MLLRSLTTILNINVHLLLLVVSVLLHAAVWAAGTLPLPLLLLLLLLVWLCLLLELLHKGAVVAECVDAASNSLEGLNNLQHQGPTSNVVVCIRLAVTS
jgi:hypothetical protein